MGITGKIFSQQSRLVQTKYIKKGNKLVPVGQDNIVTDQLMSGQFKTQEYNGLAMDAIARNLDREDGYLVRTDTLVLTKRDYLKLTPAWKDILRLEYEDPPGQITMNSYGYYSDGTKEY